MLGKTFLNQKLQMEMGEEWRPISNLLGAPSGINLDILKIYEFFMKKIHKKMKYWNPFQLQCM